MNDFLRALDGLIDSFIHSLIGWRKSFIRWRSARGGTTGRDEEGKKERFLRRRVINFAQVNGKSSGLLYLTLGYESATLGYESAALGREREGMDEIVGSVAFCAFFLPFHFRWENRLRNRIGQYREHKQHPPLYR